MFFVGWPGSRVVERRNGPAFGKRGFNRKVSKRYPRIEFDSLSLFLSINKKATPSGYPARVASSFSCCLSIVPAEQAPRRASALPRAVAPWAVAPSVPPAVAAWVLARVS